jgi:glucosyltransferase
MKKLISIVVPCFNEEEALPFFYEEINKTIKEMKDVDFEVIFVNDGSKDNTLNLLRKYSKSNKIFRYISFSRNFGKEAAILAGFRATKGDYVAMMDADLQDPPKLLPEMYKAVSVEGYDSAATRRTTRKGEPPVRSFFAHKFYSIINKISDADIVDGARDYRLMNRKMVNAILDMSEVNRFSKGIFGWIGFKTKWIDFENVERVAGKTKWSFWKLFKYSIEGIVDFSSMPLYLSYVLGIICGLFGLLYLIIKGLICGLNGYEGLMCLIFILSGIQMILIGIVGEYIARTYTEARKRPVYIVSETEKDRVDNEKDNK